MFKFDKTLEDSVCLMCVTQYTNFATINQLQNDYNKTF